MQVRKIGDVVAGVFVLLVLYLVLAHGTIVSSILKTISEATVKSIVALQGRQVEA